jgi:hypothetical protein
MRKRVVVLENEESILTEVRSYGCEIRQSNDALRARAGVRSGLVRARSRGCLRSRGLAGAGLPSSVVLKRGLLSADAR